MRHRAILRTMLAVAVGFGALLPATMAAAAGPVAARAAADPINCCQVGIDGLPGRIQAGAPPRFFTVRFQNNAQQPVTRLSITFTAQAPALKGGQLHLERQAGNNWHGVSLSRRGDGLFRGTDNYDLHGGIQPGATQSWIYQVSASKSTAAGPISVALLATGRLGDGHDTQQGELASSETYQTSIVAVGEVTPTPTPTPTPSDTPTPDDSAAVTAPTTETTPDTQVAAGGGRGGGIAWLAYTIGALLLLGGIATIGTILWRRGPQEVETDWEQPAPPVQPAWAPPPVDPYDTNIGMPPYPPTATYPTATVTRPPGGTYGRRRES